MLNKLVYNFKTLTKSLEILYILENVKPVSRILIEENEIPKISNFLKEHNLRSALSDFKIADSIDTNRTYSDQGIKIDRNSNIQGKLSMYVSKSQELAEQAKQLEAKNKHTELGILLGYPKCCSEFFENNFQIESKRKNDYTLAALRNSNGFSFPFYTNIAIRHMDLTLLSHFPCSFTCKHSIKIAKNNLKIIEKYSRRYHNLISDMLKGAVIYTEDNGVFLLKDIKVNNNKLFYKRIIGPNNPTHNLLKSSPNLEIINKNIIKINNKELTNLGFILFS